MAKQAKIKKTELINKWSENAILFVNSLIQRKQNRRLGINGIEEVKMHPWFKHFPWKYLKKKGFL